MFLARIFVSLKPTVNDPQGLTVQSSLKTLGFDAVESVRVGKYLEVKLGGDDRAAAERAVDGMCSKLLANPVIEHYSFELETLEAGSP